MLFDPIVAFLGQGTNGRRSRVEDIDFVFLIFHPHWPGVSTLDNENDWRDRFLKDILEKQLIQLEKQALGVTPTVEVVDGVPRLVYPEVPLK